MPHFDRPISLENQILAENAQYPTAPPNLPPEVAERFDQLARSVAPSFWRTRAERGQLLSLAYTELLVERLGKDVLNLPLLILEDKVHPLLTAYTQATGLASRLRTSLGLTVQAA